MMRLIPPEGTPVAEVEKSPMTLRWFDAEGGKSASHSGEYLLDLLCITGVKGRPDQVIPDSIANKLGEMLGAEWWVDNRGTRIEISHVPLGPSNHELMMETTVRLLEEVVLPRFGSQD
jgi:hypothetical protein